MRELTRGEFDALMLRVAEGWATGDVELSLSAFAKDAVYMEPPDIQLYTGHEELRPYFAALEPGSYLRWRNLWFDTVRQAGAGEFAFGVEGSERADHGVIVVELDDGLIAFWREYQRPGPAAAADFLATDGKEFEWHIGNYP